VLYLAEVQKKGGVIRSTKVELKLLACQRGENNWSAVPDEVINAPDDCSNYNAGALVMVELTGSKQVQRHSEAGRQLVTILQNFSRMQDRSKSQEEEIEQWKESLTYQSQELNRREMELESRQEQLQEMEDDFAKLEEQRQEIEALRQSVEQQQQEYERKSQELEGAWAHLQGEMNRLEEQQGELSQMAALDDEKAQQMQELLDRLSGAIAPTDTVRAELNHSYDILNQQREGYNQQVQSLEPERGSAQQRQEALDGNIHLLQQRWQEYQAAQIALEAAKVELAGRQQTLASKQEYIDALTAQLKRQEELQQHVFYLADSSDQFMLGSVDVSALDQMDIDELQKTVDNLTKDLEKMAQFVASQEEELTAQQDEIDSMKGQIDGASEYDRLRLESELADEQDRYRMLEETLVGQRRTVQERRDVLKQHQQVLSRRTGEQAEDGSVQEIDLSPVLDRLDDLKRDVAEQLKQAQDELQGLQGGISQQQATVDQQATEQAERWNALQELEQSMLAEKAAVGELWGRLNLVQENAQQVTGDLSAIQEKLDAITVVMNQFQETSDYQLQAIAEMRQLITSLTQNQAPEFVS
jgi:chromosome segregation ATPase